MNTIFSNNKFEHAELSCPPKPPLTFRVGVVGHRPNRLKSAEQHVLESHLKDILASVKAGVESYFQENPYLFSSAPPVLRAISPLAEGVDRLFAKQALDLGFQLCCPLPFSREEFENDFDPEHALEANSLSEFQRLIAESKTVFELDGDRKQSGAAYGTCGRVVLNQSDLLVIVWDGERQGKDGGTEETVDLAIAQGVSVVLIDAKSPHGCQIVESSGTLKRPGILQKGRIPDALITHQLTSTVKTILAFPEALPKDHDHQKNTFWSVFHLRETEPLKAYQTFLKERKPFINFGIPWKFFRDMFGDSKITSAVLWVDGFEKSVEKEWARDETTVIAQVGNRLRPYYAWPDKLAVAFGDTYRSAFLTAYLLAAISVGLALLPVAMGWSDHSSHIGATLCIGLELCAITTMLVLIILGRFKRWHERWLDYRLAAELIRHLRLVAPLGGERPLPKLPAHLSGYAHLSETWMAWYVRAVERELGLPKIKMIPDHIHDSLTNLIDLLNNQIEFHETSALRCRNISHRLHATCMGLLAFTILAGLLHLKFHWLGGMATFICGFFPALGAGLEGINNQGEFRRIEKRSKSMTKSLRQLVTEATRLQTMQTSGTNYSDDPMSLQLARLTNQAARLMVKEILDWRVVFLDRPLNPTH